jgi:hypothetical protein
MLVDTTPIVGALQHPAYRCNRVRRTGDEPLFNSLMEQHLIGSMSSQLAST